MNKNETLHIIDRSGSEANRLGNHDEKDIRTGKKKGGTFRLAEVAKITVKNEGRCYDTSN